MCTQNRGVDTLGFAHAFVTTVGAATLGRDRRRLVASELIGRSPLRGLDVLLTPGIEGPHHRFVGETVLLDHTKPLDLVEGRLLLHLEVLLGGLPVVGGSLRLLTLGVEL